MKERERRVLEQRANRLQAQGYRSGTIAQMLELNPGKVWRILNPAKAQETDAFNRDERETRGGRSVWQWYMEENI